MMTAFWDAMFPPQEAWPRYAECGVRKHPRAGDISCRSALTIHRGTVHPSQIARPVLVLGVDAPPIVREHLVCRVVDTLVPLAQKHGIEGLVVAGQR